MVREVFEEVKLGFLVVDHTHEDIDGCFGYLSKKLREQKGPTILLGASHAPLDHYFILKIFLESFKHVFQKNMKFLKSFFNMIMLRCILKKSRNMSLKNIFKLFF
jgi:hypothetical protein